MHLNKHLKRLFKKSPPQPENKKQNSIPQAWLDAAQKEAGLTFSREEIEQSRSAEKQHDIDVTYLRQTMLNNLTLEQLNEVAAKIGVAPSQLFGGKGRRVLALLQSAEKGQKVPALLLACQTIRPKISWQPTTEPPK